MEFHNARHHTGMKKIFTLIIAICFALQAKPQSTNDSLLKWLNTNAINLAADDGFPKLTTNLNDNLVLSLGEASHGTKEFYKLKKDLIAYLVQNLNYKSIGIEYPADEIEKANQFVLTGHGDLKEIVKNYRLYGTQEFYDLFTWLKNYNQKLPDNEKIEIYGLDKNYSNPFERDSLMAGNVVKRQSEKKEKTIVWAHNMHIANQVHIAQNKAKTKVGTMGYHLKKTYNAAYYAIALDTYSGTVNTMEYNEDESFTIKPNTLESPKDNFTTIFAQADFDPFFINFRTTKPNPFSRIEKGMTRIQAHWRGPFELPIILGENYDAVIFIKNTNAAEILK